MKKIITTLQTLIFIKYLTNKTKERFLLNTLIYIIGVFLPQNPKIDILVVKDPLHTSLDHYLHNMHLTLTKDSPHNIIRSIPSPLFFYLLQSKDPKALTITHVLLKVIHVKILK